MLAEAMLATLRRTESALGPGAVVTLVRAGLATADGAWRRTLLLAGLGVAHRSDDRSAFASFASEWASAGGDGSERRALSLVARLAAAERLDEASLVARAERERHRSAEAALALGAALERSGQDAQAAAFFHEAATLGIGSVFATRASAAALRYAEPERADEAERRLGEATDPRTVIRLAPAALGSGRTFARVRTLDRLAELASAAETRSAALRIALAFVDRRGSFLGDLERDRVTAIASSARASAAVRDALAGRSTLDVAAARDALMGHTPAELADRATTMALRALAAAVRGDGSASLLVSALTAHPPSPAGWTAVLVALGRPVTRAAAIATTDRWLALDVAPPRGFSVLADALEHAEAASVAERAWMAALRAAEPGARARMGAMLAERAHDAYARGDLAAARAAIARSLAIAPE